MNAGDLVEFKQISENGSNEGPLAIGTIVDFDSDGDPIVMVWFIDAETNERYHMTMPAYPNELRIISDARDYYE